MAELTTIARPYAKAAFLFAREAGALEQWENMLALAAAVAEQPAMRDWLRQPQLTAQQKSDAFCEVCGDGLDDNARNFIAQLGGFGRLELLPVIYELYHAQLAAQTATVDVELVSASALEDAEVERLVASLKQRLGRDVRVSRRDVDEALIGGVLIRAGDTVIDGSVRGRLARLAEQLNS